MFHKKRNGTSQGNQKKTMTDKDGIENYWNYLYRSL